MKARYIGLAGLVAAALIVSGCSSGQPSAGGKVQLTEWFNGDCPKGDCVDAKLIKGFEAQHPNISIKLVVQPSNSYFTALKAALVSGQGPDLGTMWPGGSMIPFLPYMVPVKEFMPESLIRSSDATHFYSKNDSNNTNVYAVPTGDQWYTGFYNKKIFAENGITNLPQTWDELNAVCKKLKNAGVLPIVNGAQYGSAQMTPLFEWSYLAAVLPISNWPKLYNGTMKYDNPQLSDQLTRWAALYKAGYLNSDAYNNPNPETIFEKGKAAMFFSSGSWEISNLSQAMGSELGVLRAPYSSTPQDTISETAGSAIAVFKNTPHKAEAGEFLHFVLSDDGQKIIAGFGLPPTRAGFKTTSPAMNELIAISSSDKTRVYPMFDDFTQPTVTTAIINEFSQVLVGRVTPSSGLKAVDAAVAALPADQRDVNIQLTGK